MSNSKEDWNKLYELLDGIMKKFLLARSDWRNSKNSKSKKDADKEMKDCILLAKFHVKNNAELYGILLGEHDNVWLKREIVEEFDKKEYFLEHIDNLLKQIKTKI